MEVAGLVIGAVGLVGLAGLLNSCMQLAEQISDTTEFPRDSSLLECKWSASCHLLRRWARMVGIDGREILSTHHADLDEQEVRDQVLGILIATERLLRDHSSLSKKYGLRVLLHSPPGKIEESSPARSQLGKWRRNFRWSVYDKARFETLIKDMSFFVQKLFRIISPPDETVEHIYNNLSERVYAIATTQEKQLKEFIADSMGTIELSIERSRLLHREQMEKLIEDEKVQRQVLEQLDGIERVQILQWLNAYFTDHEFDSALRARCAGTCEWFIKRVEYQEWVGYVPSSTAKNIRIDESDGMDDNDGSDGLEKSESADSTVRGLWIFGNPGSGKTFLSARVVEYFKTSCALPFAYFFCAFDGESNNPEAILRSWIAQIAMSRQAALKIVQLFRKGNETRSPTLSILWTMYSRIIRAVHHCRFLIDGLDECSRSEPSRADHVEDLRSDFLRELCRATKDTTAKFIVISRDVGYIRSNLSPLDAVVMQLKPADTLRDLRMYARAAVDKQLGKQNFFVKERISEKLASKADGMFLWVRLELPRLKPRMSLQQLDTVLESMPTGAKPLQKTYGRCLQEIAAQQEITDVKRAFEALRWTLYSLVPLDIAELMEVLDYSENKDSFSSCDHDEIAVTCFKDEVLYICQPLLRFVTAAEYGKDALLYERSAFFRFTHFSVKEYLIGPGAYRLDDDRWLSFDNQGQNHRYCADVCASYLSQNYFSKQDTSLICKLKSYSHRFLEYASCYGIQHAKLSDSANETFQRLFTDPSMIKNFDIWTRFWSMTQKGSGLDLRAKTCHRDSKSWHGTREREIPPLWFAALLGVVDVVERLLKTGHDPDERADVLITNRDFVFDQGTALFAAIAGGSSATVKLLLGSVGVSNAKRPCCTYLGTARKEVAGTSYPSDHRNYQRNSCGIYTNPLGIAVHFQNVEVVQLLLDSGVNVNYTVKNMMSPLRQAFDHLSMVETLLCCGADINALNEPYGTVLQAAAAEGSEPIVRLLLENGANVNDISGYHGTAAQAASNSDVLLLLAKSGADLTLTRSDQRYCNEDSKQLIQHIDLDRPSEALAITPATLEGDPILRLVSLRTSRRKGADGCTALHYACRLLRYSSSILSWIQQYVDAGADINSCSKGGTPLEFLVAQRDHPDHIAYLLQNGADPRLLSSECISSLTLKPYSRFIYTSNHTNGASWLEFPVSAANPPRWNAQELDEVKALLQTHGLDHPEVYFDLINWTPPHTVALTHSLLSERQAKRQKLIESV